MRRFRDLQVWNKAHMVALRVHRLTQRFPPEERYGLVSQMRRSAASVPANIAEGSGQTEGSFVRYLEISLGSANELDYQLLLSKDLGYLPEPQYSEASGEVLEIQKMLGAMIRKIRPR